MLFISRDACSDSLAKLFRACFCGVSHNYLEGISAPKKKVSPPPKFPANTLPAPRPPAPTHPGDPPSWDFPKKKSPPPKIFETSTKIICLGKRLEVPDILLPDIRGLLASDSSPTKLRIKEGDARGRRTSTSPLMSIVWHPGRPVMSSMDQQFTYGVVREGVIAENFPQISAKFPRNFRTLS